MGRIGLRCHRVERLKRGDVVTIAGGEGDYGSKPRPAIIIQSDLFSELESVSVLPLTSSLEDAPVFRVVIEPTGINGIAKLSQAMVDKMMPVRKERIREVMGALDRKTLIKIESAIALFYGMA